MKPQQVIRELDLQNRFVGSVRREELALDVLEGIIVSRGRWEARHHGEMRLALVVKLGNESNVGCRLEHIGQARNVQTRVLVEGAALRRRRAVAGCASFESAKCPSRCDHNRVEEPGSFQPAVGQLLQTNTQGEHRHERGDADTDAQCGQ